MSWLIFFQKNTGLSKYKENFQRMAAHRLIHTFSFCPSTACIPPSCPAVSMTGLWCGRNEGDKFLRLWQKPAYFSYASHTLQSLQNPLEGAGPILHYLGMQFLFPNFQSHFFFSFFGHTPTACGTSRLNSRPLQWKHRALTTGPSGKSCQSHSCFLA